MRSAQKLETTKLNTFHYSLVFLAPYLGSPALDYDPVPVHPYGQVGEGGHVDGNTGKCFYKAKIFEVKKTV